MDIWVLLPILPALTTIIYATAVYPTTLRLLYLIKKPRRVAPITTPPTIPSHATPFPFVTVCIVAHNAAPVIRHTISALLASSYPSQSFEVVVVSDASDDGTDEIVRHFPDSRVRLVRMPTRVGKTRAENSVASELAGDIIINTDAAIRMHPGALSALVSAFADPSVGAASGIDLPEGVEGGGESRYLGFEMWLRSIESCYGGIVGNSGSIYATRKILHNITVPHHLSRDFASALVAHEAGYKSVLVPDAFCYVPESRTLYHEYHRKVRTSMRGMQTLWYFRHLLSVRRHKTFAFKLWSHKVSRWMIPPLLFVVGPLSFLVSLLDGHVISWLLTLTWALSIAFGLLHILGRNHLNLPGVGVAMAYIGMGTLAGTVAFLRAPLPPGDGSWEPTVRHIPTRKL